jgi:hypothetical protein
MQNIDFPAVLAVAGQTFFLMTGVGSGVTDSASGFSEKIRMSFFPRKGIVFPVAAPAVFDFQMNPFQNNSSLFVIEIFGIERNERDIHSLMFGMTDRTVFTLVPVISPRFSYPGCDLLVTSETPGRLNFQVFIVTFAAIFEARGILVSGTQLSRGVGNIEYLLGPHMEYHQEGCKDQKRIRNQGYRRSVFYEVF